MKVLNKKTDTIPFDAVYVGRPSKWGNPFRVRVHSMSQHKEAVRYYEGYIKEKLTAGLISIEELRGKDLVCWCAPLPCHADILLELANNETP